MGAGLEPEIQLEDHKQASPETGIKICMQLIPLELEPANEDEGDDEDLGNQLVTFGPPTFLRVSLPCPGLGHKKSRSTISRSNRGSGLSVAAAAGSDYELTT